MSFVKRQRGKAETQSHHPCGASNCQRASEYFCDVRSVGIANSGWL